jgi:molybdopterin-guanine dinucleotide biosynthesis adapter protein
MPMTKVIGFAGYSGSGKTTIISSVLHLLKMKDYQVAVIKHDAHGHYKEETGADSTLFIQKGADSVITVSPNGLHTFEKQADFKIEKLIASLESMDYILIEGFKMAGHPKIIVFRTEGQRDILAHLEELEVQPIAIATDMDFSHKSFPVLNLNNPQLIVDFILAYNP